MKFFQILRDLVKKPKVETPVMNTIITPEIVETPVDKTEKFFDSDNLVLKPKIETPVTPVKTPKVVKTPKIEIPKSPLKFVSSEDWINDVLQENKKEWNLETISHPDVVEKPVVKKERPVVSVVPKTPKVKKEVVMAEDVTGLLSAISPKDGKPFLKQKLTMSAVFYAIDQLYWNDEVAMEKLYSAYPDLVIDGCKKFLSKKKSEKIDEISGGKILGKVEV